MSFTKITEEHTFELTNVATWGVEEKFKKYQVPVILQKNNDKHQKVIKKLEELFDGHKCNNPFHRTIMKPFCTLRLTTRLLSKQQKEELLDQGRCNILVSFTVTGVYHGRVEDFLCFKITKLRRVKSQDDVPPED